MEAFRKSRRKKINRFWGSDELLWRLKSATYRLSSVFGRSDQTSVQEARRFGTGCCYRVMPCQVWRRRGSSREGRLVILMDVLDQRVSLSIFRLCLLG